jgi:hypothetical protein
VVDSPIPLGNAERKALKTIMTSMRNILGGGLTAALLAFSGSAQAQIFLKSPDFSGAPVTGVERDVVQPLPDAKPEELRAGLVWSMRAALNVAALQCQFEPTLLTLNQYNVLIRNRSGEFTKAYNTLNGYFKRINKNPKIAQNAIDQYGTRTYLGFSTVQGQLGFCLTASRVGRAALFAPRDGMDDLAVRRLRELRNSLIPMGEQQFSRFVMPQIYARHVTLDPRCWDKKNMLKKNCVAQA